MSIEPKILRYLRNNVRVVRDRVYFPPGPQGGVLPYLTVRKISEVKDYTHDGPSGLSALRFQVSVFGKNYVDAKRAAVDVKTAMDSWRADGIKFAPLENETDLYEESTKLYHIPLDFFIQYQE